MPLMSNITVNDREDTPVAHIFKPHYEESGVAFFREDAANLVSQNKLTVSSRESGQKVKKRVKLEMPITVTETVNGVDYTRVVDREFADLTLTLSANSEMSSGKNVVGILANLLLAAQTDVDSVIVGNEKFR